MQTQTSATKIATMLTPNGLTIYFNGQPHVIASDHPRMYDIKKALREERYDDAIAYADIQAAITNWATDIDDPKFSVENGQVIYDGFKFPPAVSQKLLDMMSAGMAPKPLVKFLQNVLENPSNSAVEELFLFVEANGLPIDEDGYIIAYRAIRHDWMDKYTGTVSNHIGAKPSMPRKNVDDRRDVTCSHGFHFAAYQYAAHCYGHIGPQRGDRLIVVRIHPKDVVSIPSDYNNQKGRCCAYEVLSELPSARPLAETPVYTARITNLSADLFALVSARTMAALDFRNEADWDRTLRGIDLNPRVLAQAITEKFGVTLDDLDADLTIAEVRDLVERLVTGREDEEEFEDEIEEEFEGDLDDADEIDFGHLEYTLNKLRESILDRRITFAGEFRDALRVAGFDPSNPDVVQEVEDAGLSVWL